MKKQIALATIMGVFALSMTPTFGAVTAAKDLADGMEFAVNGGTLRVRWCAEEVVRVTFASGAGGAEGPVAKSLAVVAEPKQVKWTKQENGQAYTLRGATIQVSVDKQTGAVTFMDAGGRVLLREAAEGRRIAPTTQEGISGNACAQTFELPADEGIYGLGQHQQGVWNYRGRAVRLLQQNTEVGIPVMLSSKQYVLLWDNPAVTEISVGAAAPAATASAPTRGRGGPAGAGESVVRWSSEVGKAIDYYFCFGGNAEKSMAAYRKLTGDAPMLPQWAWGFLHSKERYRSQAEMLEVAREFRKNNIPIDVLIQDWRYWPDNTWGSHDFDKARYPDPAGMFKELHGMGYHALISVWPKFDLGTANSDALIKAGAMYEPVIPYVYPPGKGQWYDAMSAAGRETYWKALNTQLFPLGVDGWWLDAPEPELSGKWGEYRTFKTALGPGAEVFNAYPLMHSKGIYDGQRGTTNDKRVLILTRSAWAGQQRNSAITWSGDIGSSWQVFRNQIPAGLNFVASGIPYWNTDTGGFFNNAATGNMMPNDPRYQEIFTRWFQFSAFCSMFRVHGTGQNSGTGIGKEIYRFPEPARKNLLAMLDLRYRLLPYIYSTAWQVTSEGASMMRPLVMDFAEDMQAASVGDQLLFGPSLMAIPVTTQGATTRSIYLPKAPGGWVDFWTGKVVEGGARVDAAAPIEIIPLFVRAGAIVPMGPTMQHTGEKAADPVELRVYRGADGAFTLYEDEGDSYRYEKGACATIPIRWDNGSQTLTIGQRKGEFPGMLKERTFQVVFVGADHGGGIGATEKVDGVVRYTGAAVAVKAGG